MLGLNTLRPVLRSSAPALSARAFSASASQAMARMILTGRLATEPEAIPSSTGVNVIKYTIASTHGRSDNRFTSYFRVTSFLENGPQKDFVLSLSKGTLVCIDADVSLKPWEDAEGRRHSSLNIIQKTLEVLKRPNPNRQTDNGVSDQFAGEEMP
ncbi:hypothetical protein ASPZODRAFT_130225 [Penicilliopsis zonata CBS 506.65]|uniref:SsDNA binding protein n=1 Tax=Penicilliopsis zonata CBS 506.65 TaxID=1073090 RepID=A0A1L9SLV2_9EURO|nr:hypothetical protein ASPZODRAFT_130225 [Penicilliopsis zonata CBS 506.65]OJJ48262.1 hypothetical protein ASPZODRAFT_130225 [Penicilliopsis zonata CBS 506.65]